MTGSTFPYALKPAPGDWCPQPSRCWPMPDSTPPIGSVGRKTPIAKAGKAMIQQYVRPRRRPAFSVGTTGIARTRVFDCRCRPDTMIHSACRSAHQTLPHRYFLPIVRLQKQLHPRIQLFYRSHLWKISKASLATHE